MRILGIDPATKLGWCYIEGDEISTGVELLRLSQREERPALLHRLSTWLQGWRGKVDLLATEESAFGSINRNTQAFHDQCLGVIYAEAHAMSVDVMTYKPTSIKKFATDNGRSPKNQIVAAAVRLFGLPNIDDNQADALFVAHMARQGYQAKPAKPKPRRRRSSKPASKRLF